jgi:peptide/nickel transport system substrate-binding protein
MVRSPVRVRWSIGCGVAAALIAVGCGGGSKSQTPSAAGTGSGREIPVLNVGIAGKVPIIDPAKLVTGGAGSVNNLGLEGLTKIDADGKVKPHLAQAVRHPSPTKYVYALRKDVTFWDGSEMTSADVANALQHYAAPKTQSATYYRSVRSIEATDRYEVTVTLKHPDASWEYTPAFLGGIFQKKSADAQGKRFGQPGALPVGTGPWKFDRLDPARGVELSRHERYWNGKPSIRRISIKSMADETSMALAFRAGQIDVALPFDGRVFSKTSGSKVASVQSCNATFLSMNTKLPPWSDVHVRRAVAHAIDRKAIAKALGGAVTPVSQIIPPQLMAGVASRAEIDELYGSLPTYPFDLDKAKEELAQSKYSNGFGATINATSGVPYLPLVDQVLAASLKKIGIDLKVKNLPVNQWTAQFYGPRDELPIFVTPSGCAIPDPSWYPGVFLSSENAREGGTNLASYANATVDELMRSGLATDAPARRREIYGKLLEIVGRDVPYLALYAQNANLALSSKYAFPGFNAFITAGEPWALGIRSGQGT